MGDAVTVGELAALCVKGKQERLAPKTIRAPTDPETVVSVITIQHTDLQSSWTSETDKFY